MAKVWVLDTETKGTGAEMRPLEKALETPASGRAPVLAPELKPRPKPSPPRGPWRFKLVDVMTREVVGEDADPRTAVTLLRRFRSVVDVSVYAWDDTKADWRPLTLGERRTLWSFRDRSPQGSTLGESRRRHAAS